MKITFEFHSIEEEGGPPELDDFYLVIVEGDVGNAFFSTVGDGGMFVDEDGEELENVTHWANPRGWKAE